MRDIKKQLQKVTYLIEKDYAVLHLFNLNWINFAVFYEMQTRNYVKLHSVTLGERRKVSNIFYCDFEDVSVIEENFEETGKVGSEWVIVKAKLRLLTRLSTFPMKLFFAIAFPGLPCSWAQVVL